ncbi:MULTISPECIES: hypothetical protein [Bacillus]|uniref:Uncharacterized protein n=2 Tax=Bacillus TaxID=1386 RepID=A0A0M3RAB3_9BACI|nr:MULTISPECIES: hypothetical protein [Bacillus]ALC82876.1 hypothetical protein AM592_15735 [Bacillus gobiensis]MBP1081847.1 uncharacterized protein YacL [Bacillus capparidis]MED1096496.1 hypothetical protein [Bacillus capparidis]
MNVIHWYDFLTPTTPMASITFGLVFTLLATIIIGFQFKSMRVAVFIFVICLIVTFGGTAFLNFIGYYG